MASMRTNRRVYSAEELHRLRGTTSQPKLREAIEAHDGDDAELVKGTQFATPAALSARPTSYVNKHPTLLIFPDQQLAHRTCQRL